VLSEIVLVKLKCDRVVEKLHHREMQLSSLLDYIKELEAWRLDGYDGDDVEHILYLLQHPQTDGRSRGTPNFTLVGDPGLRNDGVTRPTVEARPGAPGDGEHGTATYGTANEQTPNADIAHALHFASIGLLGLLVIEV